MLVTGNFYGLDRLIHGSIDCDDFDLVLNPCTGRKILRKVCSSCRGIDMNVNIDRSGIQIRHHNMYFRDKLIIGD